MTPVYPASFLQERIYRLAADGLDHDVSLCGWIVEAPLDRSRCLDSLAALVERHEILRTSMATERGRVVQRVHRRVDLPVEFMRPADGFRERIAAVAAAEVARPVSLMGAPWWSLTVVPGARAHALVWRFGHAGWDAASAAVLVNEYADPAAPPLPLQFGELAAAERLAGAGSDRGEREPYAGVEQAAGRIDGARLAAVARAAGATPPIALLARFAPALGAALGKRELTIAVFDANRDRPGRDRLIGCVANLLLVEIALPATLEAMRDAVLRAYDDRRPIEHRLGGHSPLRFADGVFNFHAQRDGRFLPLSPPRRVLANGPWTGADIALNASAGTRGEIDLWFHFNEHRFAGERVAAIGRRVRALG